MTSSRPGAGSEKRAGCASSTPTTSRISSSTARPGGLSRPATTTSSHRHDGDRLPRAPPRLRLALGEGRAARLPTSARAPRARPGSRSAPVPSSQPLLERVEPAAQARVDGSPRQAEQLRDLAGRVLEQVAEDDHGAMVGRQRGERPSSELVERGRVLGRRDRVAELGLAPQLPRARPVDRAVDDDPVQPRPERAAAGRSGRGCGRRPGTPPGRCPRRPRRRGRRGRRRGTRAASAGERAPRSPRRTLAAPRARRRARRGRRPSADSTAAVLREVRVTRP